MFSHVTVGTSDLERAGVFYDAVLTLLGLNRRAVTPDGGPRRFAGCRSSRLFPDSMSTSLAMDNRPPSAMAAWSLFWLLPWQP
jgi:catechol 2,3-dioxygenase-like lactoylglutathione lyase family enzyme